MGSARRIVAVTSSRADYGLLYSVLRAFQADSAFDLQLVVTGMHLAPEFGETVRAIGLDGFPIAAKVDMLVAGDSNVAVAKSIGLGTIGFADTFSRLKPELLLLLGDRFEIFAAAQAAHILGFFIAHLCGGDVTEGAIDDALRHSITKMAHLHFVTNKEAVRRVRQMGENPACIFNVGSPGLDYIRQCKLLDRAAIELDTGFRFRKQNLLVTFHPATLERGSAEAQVGELLCALDRLGGEVGIVFTGANADAEGRAVNRKIEQYTQAHANTIFVPSLGQQRYLSVMAQVDALVGNSSSGLYEAPTLKKPAVNVGDRQKGRMRAASVIDCAPVAAEIEAAIVQAFCTDCAEVVNPYGDGNAAAGIVAAVKRLENLEALGKKTFFEVSCD